MKLSYGAFVNGAMLVEAASWFIFGMAFIWPIGWKLDSVDQHHEFLGSFVSGWLSPVGFFAVIISLYYQRKALSHQQDAIQRQSEQMEIQSIASSQQAEAARTQAEMDFLGSLLPYIEQRLISNLARVLGGNRPFAAIFPEALRHDTEWLRYNFHNCTNAFVSELSNKDHIYDHTTQEQLTYENFVELCDEIHTNLIGAGVRQETIDKLSMLHPVIGGVREALKWLLAVSCG